MPALHKLFSFHFLFYGCTCVLLHTACNLADKTGKKNDTDSLQIIELPKPLPVLDAEAGRIKNSCQLWYDTVLLPKGFNGGIIVAKNGNIIFEQYSGTGHLPGNDFITDSTPMHIASITKTFTAMAVLKLQQDGKLNIDDDFSKYFPAFNYPGVTLRTLLNHRSGLPNYNYFMETLGWDKNRFVKNEDVLNYLITYKAVLSDVLPPGAHFSYCNTNYALLALLIEKITGFTYAAYLNRSFFMPLQMKNTYVFSLADTLKAIPSYNWRGTPETFNFLDQVYGDKNIYTTPRDLLIWDRVLATNLIYTNETLDLAYAPYSNEKPGLRNYGLGWRMNIFPDGNKMIYHNGWWHGSNATFIRLLKEKATIIVIGNKFTRAVYHAKVLTSIFGNYYLPGDEEEIVVLKDSLKSAGPLLKSDSSQIRNSKKSKKNLEDKKDSAAESRIYSPEK
jgi:CubicO group peptidase (beta-lactamase class C family)